MIQVTTSNFSSDLLQKYPQIGFSCQLLKHSQIWGTSLSVLFHSEHFMHLFYLIWHLPFPFFSCFQSFPALGYFLMSLHFASGGQSIGASTSASVLPMNIQGWFPLGLTSLISLMSKGLSIIFSRLKASYPQFKRISSSVLSLLYGPMVLWLSAMSENHYFLPLMRETSLKITVAILAHCISSLNCL